MAMQEIPQFLFEVDQFYTMRMMRISRFEALPGHTFTFQIPRVDLMNNNLLNTITLSMA